MSLRHSFVAAVIGAMFGTMLAPDSVMAQQRHAGSATETRIPVPGGSLYARTIGRGPSIIVLHGGPDFDISYLLPEMDTLIDGHRLIYYDQRGRGKSAAHVRADDVSLASDVADLDAVREHFGMNKVALLGHSFGAVLALEYAVRHPTRVSRIVLLNPAPASASDRQVLVEAYTKQLGPDMDRQNQIRNGSAYQQGEPGAVAARYRIHFEHALVRPTDYEKLMMRMDSAFRRQGKEGVLEARAVEDQIYRDTWSKPGYDLMPKLRGLDIPAMVLVGDGDFIPTAIGEHIAHAIPGATLVHLEACGHFSYLECAPQVRHALDAFFAGAGPSR